MKCSKCNNDIPGNSNFCNYCGTQIDKLTPPSSFQQLVLITVGLPAIIGEVREETKNIFDNQYAYCEAIIFVEFFIRANVLEVTPSKEIALKFSDDFVDAVIKETIDIFPEVKEFFPDMFYNRTTLYDNIVMNSKKPIKDVLWDIVEFLTYIIHNEMDKDTYIIANDKNFKYFGGFIENLAIKTELVAIFRGIHDCTLDTIRELEEDFNNCAYYRLKSGALECKKNEESKPQVENILKYERLWKVIKIGLAPRDFKEDVNKAIRLYSEFYIQKGIDIPTELYSGNFVRLEALENLNKVLEIGMGVTGVENVTQRLIEFYQSKGIVFPDNVLKKIKPNK